MMFAAARGLPAAAGEYRCFFCLANCDDSHSSDEYVKSSFTMRDTVGGGQYVCGGCVAAMDEKATITLPDGETRTGQKVRSYSWVIVGNRATAASKSHREWLLGVCLSPPTVPYAIVISDSGQRHLLYRGVVGHSRDVVTMTLEGVRITYTPAELQGRLDLCKRVAAVIGKPALSESLSFNSMFRLVEYHGDESLPDVWQGVREQRLTKLAVWFTPAKKECAIEFPSRAIGRTNDRAVPAKAGWIA